MRCPVVWQQRTDVSEDPHPSVFKAAARYSLTIPQSVYTQAPCDYKHLGLLDDMQTHLRTALSSFLCLLSFRTRAITKARHNTAGLTTAVHTNVTSVNACKCRMRGKRGARVYSGRSAGWLDTISRPVGWTVDRSPGTWRDNGVARSRSVVEHATLSV
jgi:hypothetical protein